MTYQLPGFAFRPIEPGDWPGELTRGRQRSSFSASWQTTRDDLERELWNLGARDKVAQVALTEGMIRQDGMPRADARPEHPGVILAFTAHRDPASHRPHDPQALRFACDTFTSFPDNVRAIALGLESLRRVQRYGLAGDAKQYQGFQAIEAPPPRLTRDDAAARLADAAVVVGAPVSLATFRDDPAARAMGWRRIAGRFHPDRGGDPERWTSLVEARDLLDGRLGVLTRELHGSR